MEKVLFYHDKNLNEQNRRAWEMQKAALQKIIDIYNKNLPALACGELHPLFNDTVNFLYNKLTNGDTAHLTMGTGADRTHLPVNKKAAMDLIAKPAAWEEMTAAIREFSSSCIAGYKGRHTSSLAKFYINSVSKFFMIDASGNLQYTENCQKEIDDFGNRYLTNPGAIAGHTFVKECVESYFRNGLHNIDRFKRSELGFNSIFEDVLNRIDIPNKTFSAKEGYQTVDNHFNDLGIYLNGVKKD